jgi:hypothetical protein
MKNDRANLWFLLWRLGSSGRCLEFSRLSAAVNFLKYYFANFRWKVHLRILLFFLIISRGSHSQIPEPILAGAGIGKARSGDEYPAIAIGPKFMGTTAISIKAEPSIEEGAFHL